MADRGGLGSQGSGVCRWPLVMESQLTRGLHGNAASRPAVVCPRIGLTHATVGLWSAADSVSLRSSPAQKARRRGFRLERRRFAVRSSRAIATTARHRVGRSVTRRGFRTGGEHAIGPLHVREHRGRLIADEGGLVQLHSFGTGFVALDVLDQITTSLAVS